MKQVFISALLFLSVSAHAAPTFQQWCDTDLAQELVSLAANRIFGRTSSLDDKGYQERSAWVTSAYKLAADRFNTLTGEDFDEVSVNLPAGWRQRCQINSQIN